MLVWFGDQPEWLLWFDRLTTNGLQKLLDCTSALERGSCGGRHIQLKTQVEPRQPQPFVVSLSNHNTAEF